MLCSQHGELQLRFTNNITTLKTVSSHLTDNCTQYSLEIEM